MGGSDLTETELYELFELKYGHPSTTGWSPRRRLRWGYYQPGDIYEAIVKRYVTTTTRWLDVGGGRALFPDNIKLSQMLASKCKKLVAVDPSVNVYENPYAHEKINCMIEDYQPKEKFDFISFRMVAEHINNPKAVVKRVCDLLEPNGVVVIYTINKFSPIPMITYILPFSLHFKIKRFFWGGEEKDTFPVAYKMNSRKDLTKLFAGNDFEEIGFYYLDDLSTFSKFRFLNLLELAIWKIFKRLDVRYPENNLLVIYRRKVN